MSRLFTTRPGDDGLPGPERRLAVLALVLGTLMAVVDITMINLALPAIARDLGISAARAVWVTNLFQIVCAAFLLVFAAVSELVSRRRLYVAGLALFVLASLGAALSRSLEPLLVFRALQGLGAAATLSIGPSLYRSIFPSRLLGSALGLSALVVAGGYAAGPTVGGLVLSAASWPWLFALHVPLGLCALVLAWRALPREPRECRKALAVRLQPRLAHPAEQFLALVDADVAALDLVVGVGQRPADLLGAVARDGDRDASAGLEHPHHLGEYALVVGDVLHDLGDDHDVEGLVREGQCEGVALHGGGGGSLRRLPGLLHRREPLGDLADLLTVLVQRHDLGAAPVALERVPAGTAAEVQDAVARGEREPGEVDGQHVGLLSRSERLAGRGSPVVVGTAVMGRPR